MNLKDVRGQVGEDPLLLPEEDREVREPLLTDDVPQMSETVGQGVGHHQREQDLREPRGQGHLEEIRIEIGQAGGLKMTEIGSVSTTGIRLLDGGRDYAPSDQIYLCCAVRCIHALLEFTLYLTYS